MEKYGPPFYTRWLAYHAAANCSILTCSAKSSGIGAVAEATKGAGLVRMTSGSLDTQGYPQLILRRSAPCTQIDRVARAWGMHSHSKPNCDISQSI